MSKSYSFTPVIAAIVLVLLLAAANSHSQDLKATIELNPATGTAQVSGRFSKEAGYGKNLNLSFLLDYAGVSGLGKRFSAVTLTNNAGETVGSRPIMPGEFLAERPFIIWKYLAELKPEPSPAARAHISWLTKDEGILMLHDLLPVTQRGTAEIRIDLPPGWTISSVNKRTSGGSFVVDDIENAVFFVSATAAAREIRSAKVPLRVNLAGSWHFNDQEAAEMAEDVFAYYVKLFGDRPDREILITLRKFPPDVRPGSWEADTRGTTITILSSDTPFKSQSLQKLHEQLRHEIFHLWIPNGLNLTGNYDWFYEGFALYQSLRMAVAVNRIRFEDMLDTLSRGLAIDNGNADRMSLIDASRLRWNSSNADVYARGMLVAFISDVTILDRTKGKRSVMGLIADVHRKHHSGEKTTDGNIAVLDLMAAYDGLEPIISRYIRGKEKLDLEPVLKAAGLVQEGENAATKLKVVNKPTGRQKDLLNELGYNNWRKLSRKQ